MSIETVGRENPDDFPHQDEVARKYLRPFLGSKELVNGVSRWCLWAPDGPLARDVDASEFIQSRLRSVRAWRSKSSNRDTRELAETPYRFFHVAAPVGSYIGIPAQVSASRRSFTVDYLPADVIPSNTLYFADDPTGFLFSVLSSSMFMAWLSAIGGGLKSDVRFGKAVYNSFPMPDEIAEAHRSSIIAAGSQLTEARRELPGATLSSIYKKDAVPHQVVLAHKTIDAAVDRVFGFRRKNATASDRLSLLLGRYLAMSDR